MAAPSPRIAEPKTSPIDIFCHLLSSIATYWQTEVLTGLCGLIEKRFDGCVILSTVDLTLFLLKVSTLTKVQSPLGPGLLR